ncbi:TonB-dependent receptor [Massilia sp. TWP1-3-3]|uniref:TonB-dependent receptor n=1 Tax=Massilia sp. TWP1-3-3 TaxID=2804573 RepID=UPI003CE6DBFA
MKRWCGALGLALACQPALADTVEIVGTAPLAGLGIERKLLPYSVQLAGSDQIGDAHAGNLADYLNCNLNGVNVNDISGSPFQNDVAYRGFRASPVLGTAQGFSVYLDGVRVNEPFGDVVNWDMLPESALASVLLVPGSNPVYGLNTLGGALVLTTKSGATHPGGEVDLSVTSGGRRRLDLALGAVHGNWHSFVGSTLFDDDGWRDHSQGRLGNVFAKVGRDDGVSAASVSLLGGRSQLRGNGLLPDELAQRDWRAVYTFPDETRNALWQLALNASRRFNGGAVLSALAYARRSRSDTVNGDVEEGPAGVFNTTSTRQRGQGASVLLGVRGKRHRIDIGATVDASAVAFAQFEQDGVLTDERGIVADPAQERVPASSVTGRASALGVFASDTWSAAPGLHVTAAARVNHAAVSNTLTSARGLQPRERFTYSSMNPSLGAAFEAGAGWMLVANAAQGNRVPTVIELGCADPTQPCQLPVGLQSDPYLKQVVARTLEAGARYQHGGTSASLSLYRTINRDDILFISSGLSRQGYFANFERTRHQGLDFSWRANVGQVQLNASYNYLDAAYDAKGTLFTGVRAVPVEQGTPLAGLPRHSVKLGAQWMLGESFTVGADAQVFSRMGVQGNEDGLLPGLGVAGYRLLSVRASWESAKHWELYARVDNLLNRRFASFGVVGRNLFGAAPDANTRFIAPGTPRMLRFGARYHY